MSLWRRSQVSASPESPHATRAHINRVAAHAGYVLGRAQEATSENAFPRFMFATDARGAAFMPRRMRKLPMTERAEMIISYDLDSNVVVSNRAFTRPEHYNETGTLLRVTDIYTLAEGAAVRVCEEEGFFDKEVGFQPVRFPFITDGPLTERALDGISAGLDRVARMPLRLVLGGLPDQANMPSVDQMPGVRRNVA